MKTDAPPATTTTPRQRVRELLDQLRRQADAGSAEARFVLRLLEEGRRAMSGDRVQKK
jgi:hypothetical protein